MAGVKKVVAEAVAVIFETKGCMIRMVEAKDGSLGSLMNLW